MLPSRRRPWRVISDITGRIILLTLDNFLSVLVTNERLPLHLCPTTT